MKVIEIRFEILKDDECERGEKVPVYKITSRIGQSGECPPYTSLHESHFAGAALAELRSIAKAAVEGREAAVTGVRQNVKEGMLGVHG